MDFYKVERDLLSSLCQSTCVKSNEFFFKAFAARLLQSRTSFVFSPNCRSTFTKSNENCLQDFVARLLLLGPMSSNVFRSKNYQTNFFKDPKSSAVHQKFFTEPNLWGHRIIRPQTISTAPNFKPLKTFGGSKFQTPNNPTYLNFQTQNKHMSSPSSQSWNPPSPTNQLSTWRAVVGKTSSEF